MLPTDSSPMWRLGRSLPERATTLPLVGEASIREREAALGLRPGQPFLLQPDGSPDPDVLAYFFSPSFGLLSDQTQLSYAKDLRLFLSFLQGQGRPWRDASVDDALDYEFWRRRDERNTRRVSASRAVSSSRSATARSAVPRASTASRGPRQPSQMADASGLQPVARCRTTGPWLGR